MAQLGFYINSAACTGCKACELACKDKNNLDVGARLRRVRMLSGGEWIKDAANNCYTPQGVFSYSISYSCGHCIDPVCVTVCPTGAMTKDEETGIVSNDLEVCIGCGKCVEACPYNASQLYEVQKKARKCDMCRDLLDQGEEAACVGICPQRVLEIGDYADLKAKYGDLIDIQPLPDSSQTNPCVVINPHRDAVYEPGKGRLLSLEQ